MSLAEKEHALTHFKFGISHDIFKEPVTSYAKHAIKALERDIELDKKLDKRPDKDTYYLDIAQVVSRRGTCLKRHYGCVIVKDDVIIATGYNGSPRGEENCCDRGTCKRPDASRYSSYESCDAVHAEQNALIAASHDRLIGSTVYLACEEKKEFEYDEHYFEWMEDQDPIPCPHCRRMLKNAGVARVVNRKGEIQCL